MRDGLFVFASALVLLGTCHGLRAQQLPRSGTIEFHTGWKASGESIEVAAKQLQGHGSVIGTSFNDRGGGPLHAGPATCFFTFFAGDSGTKNKGYCAFGDADGDRIFTDWHGTQSGPDGEGVNEIVGGTGKYAGIQGRGPWKCKDGPNGALACRQRLDYRLP